MTSKSGGDGSDAQRTVPLEVITALFTLVIAGLIPTLSEGPSTSLGSVLGMGIPVAASILLSALVRHYRWPRGVMPQVLLIATATWAVICLTLVALLVSDARPGIAARWGHRNAPVTSIPHSDRPGFALFANSSIGQGVAAFDGRSYIVRNLGEQPATVTWFNSAEIDTDFYAEVTARRVNGPTDTTRCVLIFGRTAADPRRWFEFGVGEGAWLTQIENGSASRVLEGPVRMAFAQNIGEAHRLAVLRRGDELTLLVDDRRVVTKRLPASETVGAVTFGTRMEGDRGDLECAFTDPVIRRRR
jgi:hypothetical protein